MNPSNNDYWVWLWPFFSYLGPALLNDSGAVVVAVMLKSGEGTGGLLRDAQSSGHTQ